MIRRTGLLLLLCLCAPLALGQNVGDQYTAGYNNARTYLNSDMGDFKPPLELFHTVNLTGVSNAKSLGHPVNGEVERGSALSGSQIWFPVRLSI